MPKRPLAWVDDIIGHQQTGSSSLLNLLLAATVNLDTITVTRIIATLTLTPEDPISTTSGTNRVDIGIGVCTAAAFAAGAGSVPDPRVAADAPARGWLYRGSMTAAHQNGAGTEAASGWVYPTLTFDVGAMRKVDRGILFMVIALTAIQGSEVTWDMSGLVRSLCMT